MDMTGSQRINAPRQVVWEALNDPEILRQCITGCDELVKLSDTEMTAKVTAKVGPVSAKFSGKVSLSDIDPPNGYTITGEGTGGVAGFGKGNATVKLSEDGPSATVLDYTARAQVGGKLAQIGSRLVDSAARKMADDFFAKFSALVGAPEAEVAGSTPPSATPAGTGTNNPGRTIASPQADVRPARGSSGFYLPWAAVLLTILLGIYLGTAH